MYVDRGWKKKCFNMFSNCCGSRSSKKTGLELLEHCVRSNLQKQLSETGNVSKVVSDEVTAIKTKLADAEVQLAKAEQDLTTAKQEVHSKDVKISDLNSRLDFATKELDGYREKIVTVEKEAIAGHETIKSSAELNDKNHRQLDELTAKLKQVTEEKAKRDADVFTYEETQETMTEMINS